MYDYILEAFEEYLERMPVHQNAAATLVLAQVLLELAQPDEPNHTQTKDVGESDGSGI
jgi:hypothetical protein